MRIQAILYIVIGLISTVTQASPVAQAATGSGKSYTGWDCCKPACAWQHNLNKGITGQPLVCDINNNPLPAKQVLAAISGCDKNGTAYLCDDYSPFLLSNIDAYGFVVGFSADDCCKCYELTWTSGRAKGKMMTVQSINVGEVGGDVTAKDFVILTPGGGVGPNEAGCRNQYGTYWGRQYGGVSNATQCDTLPQNLKRGCNWRWDWAGGDINGWNIDYKQVRCPKELTDISGCSA